MKWLGRSLARSVPLVASAMILSRAAAPAQTGLGIDVATVSQHYAGNYTFGYQFRVVNAFNVVSLGFYDEAQNGLASDHRVGLWDTLGNLLASVTVASGTRDPLVGIYRMVTLQSPILLSAGSTYRVGASTGNDLISRTDYPITGLRVDPDITDLQLAYAGDGTTLRDPRNTSPEAQAYIAANFGIAPATVTPEPVSMALLGTGLVGLAGAARRRRRRGRGAEG